MPTAAGTLETIALELGRALHTLKDLMTQDFFAQLGVGLPPALAGNGSITTKVTTVGTKAGDLEPKINALTSAIASENVTTIVTEGGKLIAAIADLIASCKDLGDTVHTSANGLPPADKAAIQGLASKLPQRILEHVSVGYLDGKMPTMTTYLNVLGIIDKEIDFPVTIETAAPAPDVIPRRFNIDRLGDFLNNPSQYFKDIFQFGEPGFDGKKIFEKIQGLLYSVGLPAEIYEVGTQPLTLDAYFFHIELDKSVNPPGLKFEFNMPGKLTDFKRTVDFSDLWKGTVATKATFNAGMTATWRAPFNINIKPPSGNFSLDTLLGIKAQKTAQDPIVILGAAGSTRLLAKAIGGSVGVKAELGTAGGDVSPAFQISIEEGKLVIDFSKGDGFINKILSNVKAEADFTLLASWDPKNGLRIQGDAGVEVLIPLHIDLILIKIKGLYFSIGISTEAPLKVGLAVQLETNLGPLKAIVDHIGTNINLKFPSNGTGRLGLADIDFGFQPPKGVGLSLDTGPIKGGGFLYLDPDKGEYFGALELSFQGIIDLKAIGIINTKMPDGSTGFALLILITAEFTPIQLGFGFTLNGVGGLLGLNRSVDTMALRVGVRTGAVSSILFPQDIVANITRIISDLKSIFPIVQGHFVLAPMAKLGWGTPTLISLELGIIIDIPSPQLVILGVLRCILPTEEAAILKLQVNFAGGIDFENGIWFDASLFDSRLLVFTLTGDMALRIGWGDNPVFILSVGGFHPSFKEIPPDLVGMKRLGISLLSGDNPRLSVAVYFAVTSNTVQSGAKAELYAEACGFNVYGFLSYDLLVQFNPFYFIADIAAGIALRAGTDVIRGITIHCQLSGPTPWHAKGEASIDILFFSISVGFDVTWGDDAPSQPQEIEDVLDLVKKALNDDRNWRAELPPNTTTSVTIKKINLAPDQIIIHPFALLSVSQKVVPLELEINKFGNKKPGADTIFHLINGDTAPNFVTEEFAIANFTKLSDSEKLSRKSFEQMKSGLSFQTSKESKYGFNIHKDVNYELSYVRRNTLFKIGIFRFIADAFNIFVKGNAITKNKYSVSKNANTIAPAKVEIQKYGYAVVNTSDMALAGADMVAESEAEAYYMHDNLVKNNPSLKNKIQVVSQFEMN